MGRSYRSSEKIYQRILQFEKESATRLNGFILLLHIGTHPDRQDKLYFKLDDLIADIKSRGYLFQLLNRKK
jgi:hypothetical protein